MVSPIGGLYDPRPRRSHPGAGADGTAASGRYGGGGQSPNAPASEITLPPIDIVRSRLDLLGSAATASQGAVTKEELDLRPIYRTGQLLETVPGLVVTVHSGEGKANQYFIRGFNLDHGTDFATYVDDIPVNEPTHAHGQGYTDIHFLMPELAPGLDYTKGPFYPSVGDFGALGRPMCGWPTRSPTSSRSAPERCVTIACFSAERCTFRTVTGFSAH